MHALCKMRIVGEVLIDGEVVSWGEASFELDEQGNWTKVTAAQSDGSEYVYTRTIEYCPEQAD